MEIGSAVAIDEAMALSEEVSKMLTSLIRKLSSRRHVNLAAES
jgi:hypothetical protein